MTRWLRSGGFTVRRPSERGSGTVFALGAMGVVVILLTGGLALGGVVAATHRARSAADLAALAGAAVLGRAGTSAEACAVAASVAGSNRAGLSGCAVEGMEVVVTAEVQTPSGLPGPARAQSRAGPPRTGLGPGP